MNGSAGMTDKSLVRARDVNASLVSPSQSMVRDSSVTLVSAAMRIPFVRSSRVRRFPWRCRSSTMLEQAMAMRKREDEVFPNAAGIDVGASSHWVAVARHLAEQPVRECGAMTDDLNAMADWLLAVWCGHCGTGVHRGVLDPRVRGAGAAWADGVAGRRPADEVRSRKLERRSGLQVAAIAHVPGLAARGVAPGR